MHMYHLFPGTRTHGQNRSHNVPHRLEVILVVTECAGCCVLSGIFVPHPTVRVQIGCGSPGCHKLFGLHMRIFSIKAYMLHGCWRLTIIFFLGATLVFWVDRLARAIGQRVTNMSHLLHIQIILGVKLCNARNCPFVIYKNVERVRALPGPGCLTIQTLDYQFETYKCVTEEKFPKSPTLGPP